MNGKTERVLVYLCECGPIIKEAVDLDILARRLEELDDVRFVHSHATLCSEEGRQWLARELTAELAKDPDTRVVVAGCSPREHGTTFMRVCRDIGLNPYLLNMANIREQCTWVTPDRDTALMKAERIIRAAVARVRRQEPLEERSIDCSTDVLVIGSGVAGLTAARMLADADRNVFLVERSPAVGGRTALLSDLYPNMECGSCMLEPLMDDVLHHPKIELFTLSEVEEVLGYLGNFTVRIRKRARHVDPETCYGCKTCHEACPVEVPRESDEGLSTRKAVYIPFTGALPNASLVDQENCSYLKDGSCTACRDACPFGSIDLDAEDELVERNAGAIILATGAEQHFDLENFKSPRVITATALERLLDASGPTSGALTIDGSTPKSVALLHCMSESGVAPTETCSKICCMAFAKYVHQIHELLPECEIHEYLFERCAGGKGFREFVTGATATEKLHQVRLEPGDTIDGVTGNGMEVGFNFTKAGNLSRQAVDLAVVAPPYHGSDGIWTLGSLLRLEMDSVGFLKEDHERLRSHRTRVEGIFVAGCAQGPKDIQESALHGAAAAGGALSALVPGRKLPLEPATACVDVDRCGGCHTCVLTCPYSAISFDDEKGAAEVNELLCHGCGSCAVACPTGAVTARHFTEAQISSEIFAMSDE